MEVNRQPKSRKVPVVYYLCRNRQLDHPHFIEVSLVSPDGLYLRDVIEKFDALRGRGMASMYSWSCKRSYKNAFVWNDLGEDDLIIPVHENEYVLKGSELLGLENNSGLFAPATNINLHNIKHLAELHSSITRDSRETKYLNDDDDEEDGCHSLTKYKIYKTNGLVDSSTQTEEHVKVKKSQEPCTTSVLVENVDVESLTNDSRPSSSSGACSSLGKNDTLESLMNADGSKLTTSERREEAKGENEEEYRKLTSTKLSASNKLLKLISCGSILTQDYDFSGSSSCRMRSIDSNFLGELYCLSEDKQYFSGSLVETKMLSKEDFGRLKRSASYSTSRNNKCDSTLNRTKCIPRSIKGSLIKNPRSASMRFFERPNSCILSPCPSNNGSKRITVAKKQYKKTESFSDNKENVIKIEES